MAKYRSQAVRFAEAVQKIEDAKQEIEGLDALLKRLAVSPEEFGKSVR